MSQSLYEFTKQMIFQQSPDLRNYVINGNIGERAGHNIKAL